MESNPELKVSLKLDDAGNPIVISKDGINHYKIEISTENIPDDVYAANYQLDDSYINPFREERDKEDLFKFEITTYGDFNLAASLLGKQKNYLASTQISKGLLKSHANDIDKPGIKKALNDIGEN